MNKDQFTNYYDRFQAMDIGNTFNEMSEAQISEGCILPLIIRRILTTIKKLRRTRLLNGFF